MNFSNCALLKFGGAALATAKHFDSIARIIQTYRKKVERLVVVVSAMGESTDQLIQLAKEIHPSPPRREYDMLISAGERISVALLAMALDRYGIPAKSFTGSQSGIITSAEHSEARIVDVRPWRLVETLDKGELAIVAGFQGVSEGREITTLGRGGSDTSAVALAVALDIGLVEFFKDVKGIYSADPKSDEQAELFELLSYEEAYDIARSGSGIVHPRAIRLAQKNHVALRVRSYEELGHTGTLVSGGGRKGMSKEYEDYQTQPV